MDRRHKHTMTMLLGADALVPCGHMCVCAGCSKVLLESKEAKDDKQEKGEDSKKNAGNTKPTGNKKGFCGVKKGFLGEGANAFVSEIERIRASVRAGVSSGLNYSRQKFSLGFQYYRNENSWRD